MSWKKVFDIDDGGIRVTAEVLGNLVQITEVGEQCVVITIDTLADIAEATAKHLEGS